MKDLLVALSPTAGENSFHRYIRDDDGEPVEKMVFNTGEIVKVAAEDVEHIAKDIGKALAICTLNKNQIPRVDSEATKKFAEAFAAGELTFDKRAKKKSQPKRPPRTPEKETTSESQQTDGGADG